VPEINGEWPAAVRVTLPVVADAVIVLAVSVFWSRKGPVRKSNSSNNHDVSANLDNLRGS
ncbi:hypothetical protein LCGC14_2269730, partial [marine sediment metagenome]